MLGLRAAALRQQTGHASALLQIRPINPPARRVSTAAHIAHHSQKVIPRHNNQKLPVRRAFHTAQIRGIQIQSLSASTSSPKPQSFVSDRKERDSIPQLSDLAATVSTAFASEDTPALSAWASRIQKLCSHQSTIQQRTGIIYPDELSAQAPMAAAITLRDKDSSKPVHNILDAISTALAESKGMVSVEIGNQIDILSPHRPTQTFALSKPANESDDRSLSFLSASVANGLDFSGYIDWVFSCSRVVVVANRHDLLHTLLQKGSILSALQLHPKVTILLKGAESSKEAVDEYTALLCEALSMLGVSSGNLLSSSISIIPTTLLTSSSQSGDTQRPTWTECSIRQANSQEMLVSALDAAISCVETGSTSISKNMSASSHEYPTRNIQNTAQSKRMGHPFASELAVVFDFLAPASTLGSDKSTLSKLSSRLQDEFAESGDVAAIDRSVGAIKQRVQRWFSSGEIWKSVFMKVEEVSDTLVEDTILDRSFEEADLAMIHAAGRLNGSISNAVGELAEALDRAYCTGLTDKDTLVAADPSAVSSTMSALRGLALRKEPVNQFSLAKNVWSTRKELAESEILTSIPTYIRTSLAGFWAINAGSILASIGSLMYMGIPLVYTVSGDVAFAVLSLAWLGHRWRQLSASLYRHLDDQSAALSRKVLETHRLELWAQLDQPISKCIGKTPGIQELAPKSSNTSFENTNGALAANAASWRSQLEDIAPTRQSRIAVP